MVNQTISILGKDNWHTKYVPKFYGPSFHQHHDLAMHAKQLLLLLLYAAVIVICCCYCYMLLLLLYAVIVMLLLLYAVIVLSCYIV